MVAMAQNDVLKRYLDAGLAFTALTQSRAEALVKDLVKLGEVQADQARDTVTDLLERSRKNTEHLVQTVRKEVRSQITSMGLVSQADIDRMEKRVNDLLGAATSPVKAAADQGRTAATKATTAAKKAAPAKKTPAKKA